MYNPEATNRMLEKVLGIRRGADSEVDYFPWLYWYPGEKAEKRIWSVLVYMRGLEGVSDTLYRFFTFDENGAVVNYAEGNAGRFLPEDLREGYEEAEDKWEFMNDNARRIWDFLIECGLVDEIGIDLVEWEDV